MLLACSDLSISFDSEQGPVRALSGISFTTREGEFVSIVGPSGCGKTTLLRALAGLIEPSGGRVERIPGPGETSSRLAMVFQEQSLFPWMSALDNAAFGLEMQRVPRGERERRAREVLARFGLEGRAGAYPHQLSTGMKQRVALARAFLSDPAVLLMDEPFAALDSLTRLALQQELLELWEQTRRSVVFVTHDIDEAILLSDRLLVLGASPGRLLDDRAVPFPRPRPVTSILEPEFVEFKRGVLSMLGVGAAA